MSNKTDIQAAQYRFPYHYLVDLEREDFVRNLDWGLDYMTYMKKVMELVAKYIRNDVLDVGCGDGYLLNHLARHTDLLTDCHAVGIDVDGKAIQFAKAFGHDLPDVQFIEKNLARYEASFDLITTVETFEHIPDADIHAFCSEIDRLLERGGHLIVSVPSTVRPVIEKHFRHYDLNLLASYFPAYALREVHYVTARRNLLYQIVSKLLANRYVNLNFGPFKRGLLGLHDRFTSDVSPRRGAHIVAVFQKES